MQDLHTLNDAVSVKEVRQYLYAAFEDDPKYADFIKDLTRNPHMEVSQMRACLVAVATVKKDLVDDAKGDQQVARAARRKEIELKKKEIARAAVAQQKAHPPAVSTGRAATSGPAKAEGGPLSPEDKRKLKGQICNQYLFGSCKFGDQCNYKHMSLVEAQAEKDRREKQRTETAGAGVDKRKSDKPKKGGVSDESDASKGGVSDESDARSDKTCF